MDPQHPAVEPLREYNLLTGHQLHDLDGIAGGCATFEELLQELEQREWLTPYQVDALRRGQAERLVAGPYVLLEPRGGGGMGQVFRARHRLLERIAALKRVRPEHQDNPRMAERFLREVRAAAALAHPNIVTVYDFFQAGDAFYISMEFVTGTDLHRHVERHGPLPIASACDYVGQACLALQHAHGRGVVHRDVKPRNLIVTLDGQVKVIDFGLARRDADSTITLPGMMGTDDYVAPEQTINPHAVDGRADIYSLGCTLYHLLAGRPPFAHLPPDERAAAHRTRRPPHIEGLRPDVPPQVAAVLRRMMAPSAEGRFQRAAEVAEALAASAAVLRSDPRRVEVRVPGGWMARPENEPHAAWRPVLHTPATVDLRPGEAYCLLVESDATDEQLAGLAGLSRLTALQSLGLTVCERLTDDVLAAVRRLTGLRSLYLSGCGQLTDDGLAHLHGLTALEILDLSWCQEVTDAGVGHLRGLTTLQRLDLGGCARLTDAGLGHLRGLTALRSLLLSKCDRVPDAGLECLRDLAKLESLGLNGCRRLTDAGLAHLHQLTALRALYLAGCTRLTDAGLARLRAALPRCEILLG
jgi:serine/threonine-protein kinase